MTAGAAATPGNEWAALVRDWLEALDGNPDNHNVTLVNKGIGSTEIVFGVTRLEKDVLSNHPDLVIVDLCTNDGGFLYSGEAYEGIVCKLLAEGIPLIDSNVCRQDGTNTQAEQTPVNIAYGVPQISFLSAYHQLALSTDIRGLRAVDIWSDDLVHMTNTGHKLLAQLLTEYMQKEILDQNITPAPLDPSLPSSVTPNGYADALLVENFTDNDNVTVNMNGWTADYSARIFELSTEGWQTSRIGSTLTFHIDSGYFYLFFTLTPQSGNLEIRVDGTVTQVIDWAHLGTGYMNVHNTLRMSEAGPHTIELTLVDNPLVENDWFGICAVGASNFSGVTPPPTPTPETTSIDPITSTDFWIGSPMTLETTGGYTPGADWLKTVVESGDIVFARDFSTPLDLSGYNDGYLHLRVYVDDITRVTGGMIEIASAGHVDEEELYWNLIDYLAQSGWNDLYLPLADAHKQGTREIRLDNVNCMRVVVMHNGTVTAGIDDISATTRSSSL